MTGSSPRWAAAIELSAHDGEVAGSFDTTITHLAGLLETLPASGRSVLLTGLTLALGVATWLLSQLTLRADISILLGFAFLANLLGALLLPALAALTLRVRR